MHWGDVSATVCKHTAFLSFPHCLKNGISCRPGSQRPGWRLCNCSGGWGKRCHRRKGLLSWWPPTLVIQSLSERREGTAERESLYFALFYIPTTGFRWSKLKLHSSVFAGSQFPFSLWPWPDAHKKPFNCDVFSHFIVALQGAHNCSKNHLSTTGWRIPTKPALHLAPQEVVTVQPTLKFKSRSIPCISSPVTDLTPEPLPHHLQGNVGAPVMCIKLKRGRGPPLLAARLI